MRVALTWLAQTRMGLHGSNFWFHGPDLFSYETRVGTIRQDGSVLVTTLDYSRSTQKQLSVVFGALCDDQRGRLFRVPHLDVTRWETHRLNMASYRERIAEFERRAGRALAEKNKRYFLRLAGETSAERDRYEAVFVAPQMCVARGFVGNQQAGGAHSPLVTHAGAGHG
jgi:hypothetical protein